MSSLLRMENLTVTFGSGGVMSTALRRRRSPVVAVDGVTLDVRSGSATGIVGESGSGKSTLMRTVLGLERPATGRVLFHGAPLPMRRSLAQRRAIQMVFQDPGTTLNPAHTVGQTLTEALRVHRMVPPGEERNRVAQLLDLVQLPVGLAGARPARLSGGQKQRVAIARALAVEPEVLIADEATSALDVVVQAAILDLLGDLQRETGVTLICVSHDLELVRYLCEDVAVLRGGRVVESGPVPDVLRAPKDAYTAELIAAGPTLDRVEGER